MAGLRVMGGLRYLHAHGVVHMDVACENIGLRDGTPESAVLFDFTSIREIGTPPTGSVPRLVYGSLDEHPPWTVTTGILDFDKPIIVLVRLVEGRLPWEDLVREPDEERLVDLVHASKRSFVPRTGFGRELWSAMLRLRSVAKLDAALERILRTCTVRRSTRVDFGACTTSPLLTSVPLRGFCEGHGEVRSENAPSQLQIVPSRFAEVPPSESHVPLVIRPRLFQELRHQEAL